MKVLFFIEPVIFRGEPEHLIAHLPWAHSLAASVKSAGGIFALASNQDVCGVWMAQRTAAGLSHACFALDAFDPLLTFGYRRDRYAAALYGDGAADNALTSALAEVRSTFQPDIVVMTSQNAFAKRAFVGLPILNIEQAPLPRVGQPHRICFDPLGHQVGSLFETRASTIKQLLLPENDIKELLGIIDSVRAGLQGSPRYQAAALEFAKIRGYGRIALFVTQPPDWSTYEGAFQNIDMEGLLCAWEEHLPPGWVAVPTYHAGFRLDAKMEIALARCRPRLRFLPPELAQGMTEILLTMADGMVSISSTSSISGLLLGKRVVAVGRCPFNGWVSGEVSQISTATPLTALEAARTLAFLTNRYAYLKEDMDKDPGIFAAIVDAVRGTDPSRWFFDFSDWSPSRTQSLFNFVQPP